MEFGHPGWIGGGPRTDPASTAGQCVVNIDRLAQEDPLADPVGPFAGIDAREMDLPILRDPEDVVLDGVVARRDQCLQILESSL